jgi:hypothetical protein
MSCIPSITSYLTPAEMREAKRQKLRYTGPAFSASKLHRLRTLAESPNVKIREKAALDERLPEDLQELLVKDVESVRICLARNKKISWAVLEKLSRDLSSTVRGHVVLNYSCPEEVVEALLEDSDKMVRSLALHAKG